MHHKELEIAEDIMKDIQSVFAEDVLKKIEEKKINEIVLTDFDEIIEGAKEAKRIIKKILKEQI